MAYNRNHVKVFMTAAEAQLFGASVAPVLHNQSAADLKRRVVRTRALRDKNRDLLRRQKLATRARTGTKIGVSGGANERTGKKAAAFDEALKRLEAEAASRERTVVSKASAKKASAKKATATKKVSTAKNAPATKKLTAPKKITATKKTTDRSKPVASTTAQVLRQALGKKTSAAAKRKTAPAKRSTKAPSSGPVDAFDGIRATPPNVRGKVVESRKQAANLTPIQGHASTQVRRSQARRDSKG